MRLSKTIVHTLSCNARRGALYALIAALHSSTAATGKQRRGTNVNEHVIMALNGHQEVEATPNQPPSEAVSTRTGCEGRTDMMVETSHGRKYFQQVPDGVVQALGESMRDGDGEKKVYTEPMRKSEVKKEVASAIPPEVYLQYVITYGEYIFSKDITQHTDGAIVAKLFEEEVTPRLAAHMQPSQIDMATVRYAVEGKVREYVRNSKKAHFRGSYVLKEQYRAQVSKPVLEHGQYVNKGGDPDNPADRRTLLEGEKAFASSYASKRLLQAHTDDPFGNVAFVCSTIALTKERKERVTRGKRSIQAKVRGLSASLFSNSSGH